MKLIVTHKKCELEAGCNGEMIRIPNSPVLASYPPQYSHQCTHCGNKANYFKTYPNQNYKFDKSEIEDLYE